MADKIRIQKVHSDEEYEPSDSEDEYSEEEKEILNEVRKGQKRSQDTEQEILAFDDSDDEMNDDGDDVLMGDSDIEGADEDADDIPDAMDWGKNKRSYYNTDFVDPDFDGYTAEQEDQALAEEEEAKLIQQRLIKQMNEQDFKLESVLPNTIGVDTSDEEEIEAAKRSISNGEQVRSSKADFAGLTKRERLQLFQKDSPEFHGLITDFENYFNQIEKLIQPIEQYVEDHNMPVIPALQYAKVYQNMALTYCCNICFYLLLKSKRESVKNHPLTKRLVKIKQLLTQLEDRYETIIKPQLEALLERIVDGDKFEILEVKIKTQKRQLDIMSEYQEESKINEVHSLIQSNELSDSNTIGDDENEQQEVNEDEVRRGITYQISKNKGLTPHRKKEQRNPRVKHRGKYRKALIRRKGAVRTVRTETKRYGGEVSGIKSTVTKSIKFKV